MAALGSMGSGGVSLQEELSWGGFSLSSLLGTLGLAMLSPAPAWDGAKDIALSMKDRKNVGGGPD